MNALTSVSAYELDESTGEETWHQIGQKLFEFIPGCSGFCPGRQWERMKNNLLVVQ